jgi:type IV pilus assembly protein PilW
VSARATTVAKRAAGFTLIEMMVSVLLALIVTAAVISVFAGSREAYQATAGVAALADGGRYASNFLEEAARVAGYMACTEADPADEVTNDSPVVNQLNTVAGSLPFEFRSGIGGYEAQNTNPGAAYVLTATPTVDGAVGDWAPSLDPSVAAAGGQQIKGSDVVAFRSSLQGTPAYLQTAINGGTNPVTFPVNDGTKLQAGQIAAISDCTKAVVFQVGGTTAAQPGTVTLGGGPPGNLGGASITLPFAAGAMVQALTTQVYYIGVGSDGDGALRRLDLNGANGPGTFTDEELVPDIENMQVLYGIDTTGTLVPTSYVTAQNVPDFDDVVSIKVALLAASAPGMGTGKPPAAAPTFNLLGTTVTAPLDNRQRQVYQFTVTLRNAVN